MAVRIHAAAHDQAQAVGGEFDQVMFAQQARIGGKQRARLRIFDMFFDAKQAFLAHQAEEVVEHRQQVDVILLRILGTLQQAHRITQRGFYYLGRVGRDECAQRAAADDQQFIRLPQREDLAVRQHETTEHAGKDHEGADEDQHIRSGIRSPLLRALVLSASEPKS